MFYFKNQNRLGFRILSFILIVSSLFTLCATMIQLYVDYSTEVDIIESEIQKIQDTHVKSLKIFLWDTNYEAVSILLDSILQISEIEYIDIKLDSKIIVKTGQRVSTKTLHYSYPINYQESPFNTFLGDLNIVVSLESVQDRIKDRFFIILGTNAIKTFVMSLFILLVFQLLVTRHLNDMANYASSMDFKKLDEALILSKRKRKKQDEIDVVANSLNEMRRRLRSSYLDMESQNNKLLRLDQLKDQFLANTSHELKTPLTGIVGIIEIVQEKLSGKSDSIINQYLSLINSSTRKLLHLVNDILDFSKLKHEKLRLNQQPLDLKVVGDIVISLNQILIAGKSIQIENAIPENLPLVSVDENRIQQIFHNLITNAIKYTQEGNIKLSARVEKERVQVSVKDSGIGIALKHHETIFNSFEQVEGRLGRKHEGIGLGLAITRKLVQNHGGEISVISDTGEGSEFIFDLPIANETVVVENQQSISNCTGYQINDSENFNEMIPTSDSLQGMEFMYHILVVEDEPNTIHLLCYYLHSEGIATTIAKNGEEAFDRLNTQSFDLVLLDIMLPILDGFSICQKIRESYTSQDLPVIVISAKNQLSDKLHGLSVGANDYIEKPINKQELCLRIQNQIQLLSANRRMQSILEFSRKVGDFKDSKTLIMEAFTQIERNVYVNAIILKQDEMPIAQSGQTNLLAALADKSEEGLCQSQDINQVVIPGENPGHIIQFAFQGFEDYQMILFRREINGEFSNNTMQYLKNIIREAHSIRHSISKRNRPDFPNEAIATIEQEFNRILYVRSIAPYCEVVLENGSTKFEIPITMQEVDLYFGDQRLCRIHRMYFAIPEKATKVRKRGRDYDMVFAGVNIPIGRSYLKKIQQHHSYLFNN